MNYFRLVLTWMVLLSTSKVCVSFSTCTDEPNFVISTSNYTEVDISSVFRRLRSCTWIIERDDCSGRGVEMIISSLELYEAYKYVDFYDGPSKTYPSLGSYNFYDYYDDDLSGIYELKRSSGRFLTLVVSQEDHYPSNRFYLKYRNIPSDESLNTQRKITENTVFDSCGKEILLAYPTPNSITSPDYPREYDNSMDCKWVVVSDDTCNDDVIQVKIHALSLDTNGDHLIFYDGRRTSDPVLANETGNWKEEVITATGGSMLIEFKTGDTGTDQGFHLSYFRTKATPSFSDAITAKVTKNTAEISAVFTTSTPHTAVFWSKDGVIVQQDIRHTPTVTPSEVTAYSQPGVKGDGFRASLVITELEARDFGVYRVAVRNKFGMIDRDVLLKSSDAAPVLQSYSTFSTNATIVVTFTSLSDFEVEWYKDQHLLPASHDVIIDTERYITEDENEASTFVAILSRSPPTEPVFGNYKCIIRNDAGITELFIDLDFPNTELPILLSTAVEMNDDVITVSIDFDSNIAYPTASWYHNNVQLESSEQYRLGLDWNMINSSEWLSSRHPMFWSLGNISDNYQYPSLGGDRTSTHPNANYTATLTISGFTSEHFGSYRLFLKNLAGTTSHVIDVSMPEVFPFATCDQTESIQLVCNVTSCSDVTLSWIHSVDGVVIRKLPGNQDGTINTLTIHMCMYSDAGTYTCVGTDEETGSDAVINPDKTTLTVRSIVVLLEHNVTIQPTRILIEVPFFANPSARRITWYRNGERISPSKNDVIETEQRYVDAPVHGTIIQISGNVTSISVYSPTAQSFGMYKVTIMNEIGSSEHNIDVQNPKYVNPVIFSDTRVTYDAGSALLRMTFTSYYPESCVKWYLRGIEVGENHPADKYLIKTNSSDQVHDCDQSVRTKVAMYSTLTVTCLTEEDYGIYQAVISNHAGKTVIPVQLAEHRLAIPELVSGLLTNRSNSTAAISGSFYSTSGYRQIKWFKGDKELTNITSKYNIVNEATDIEISTDGETVVKSGFITRLSVTSLKDQDYGLYRVQIYNDFGMADSSVMLDKECT